MAREHRHEPEPWSRWVSPHAHDARRGLGPLESAHDRDVILLNLILSCVAAFQGAILLIAAKRSDQIAAELAFHDFDNDAEPLELTKDIRRTVGAGGAR